MEEYIFHSPLGNLKIVGSEGCLEALTFTSQPATGLPAKGWARTVQKELEAYFKGARQTFSFKLSLIGTDFQKRVWQELSKIPYGKTISYGELARRAGCPFACRAAAQACKKNPCVIVVPCHRVVAQNGLGGYGGKTVAGLAKKKFLLALEKQFL